MVAAAPDVTKWEAAKRGVSLFLQDCETVQNSRVTYVHAGVKTFRRLIANDFTSVFPAPGYGLVKTGGAISRAGFDAAIAPMTPGGGTPLADALLDVRTTMVQSPFGGLPADERRYLAMLTDGLLTAGAPFSSIPNGSLTPTAVFSMGFGTGAEVDYATLQTMVDKGVTLTTQQVFHGESAGTIDKFYTNALARAIGYTAVFDPLLQLYAGEHSHVDFYATSADDSFLITAQGMDFVDDNWRFHLMAPDGSMVYADPMDGGHGKHGEHGGGCGHCCRQPHATVKRGNGRLTVILQRDSADDACWVGMWKLMAAYKTRRTDIMMMPSLGALLFPLSAGPARGPRYSRLLQPPSRRQALRAIAQKPRHGLDHLPVATNRTTDACDLVVNIYAKTRLHWLRRPGRVVGGRGDRDPGRAANAAGRGGGLRFARWPDQQRSFAEEALTRGGAQGTALRARWCSIRRRARKLERIASRATGTRSFAVVVHGNDARPASRRSWRLPRESVRRRRLLPRRHDE